MTTDGGGQVSAGESVFQFDAVKPSQGVVEMPGCDVSVTSRDGLPLTVSAVDLLDAKGVATPVAG